MNAHSSSAHKHDTEVEQELPAGRQTLDSPVQPGAADPPSDQSGVSVIRTVTAPERPSL